jgi:hypothetical protein
VVYSGQYGAVLLYEAWGASCRARIKTTLPARRAATCDLLERERAEVEVHDGELELAFTRSRSSRSSWISDRAGAENL